MSRVNATKAAPPIIATSTPTIGSGPHRFDWRQRLAPVILRQEESHKTRETDHEGNRDDRRPEGVSRQHVRAPERQKCGDERELDRRRVEWQVRFRRRIVLQDEIPRRRDEEAGGAQGAIEPSPRMERRHDAPQRRPAVMAPKNPRSIAAARAPRRNPFRI